MKECYEKLNHKVDEMKNKTNDEIVSFMLKQSNHSYENNLMNVSRVTKKDKIIDKIISILIVVMLIYTMIMIPYIFFNGYPY